jgi:4'-phosphopantetheinyl transferase
MDVKSCSLRVGQVDVWLTCLCDRCRDPEADTLRLLSEAERAKWSRFVAEDARLQYLVSRALVRATLSRYADVGERAWQFGANRYGRPHIEQPAALRALQFNLSNATGLVACAVAMDCDVGVDVENIRRPLDVDALAPGVFAPMELADVRACMQAARRERFFAYWTLKEAYIKARGMGLSIPLDAFWFDLGGRSPRLHLTDRCPDDAPRWRFYRYAPTAQHRLALAARPRHQAEPSIELRWITPLSAGAALTRPCCSPGGT